MECPQEVLTERRCLWKSFVRRITLKILLATFGAMLSSLCSYQRVAYQWELWINGGWAGKKGEMVKDGGCLWVGVDYKWECIPLCLRREKKTVEGAFLIIEPPPLPQLTSATIFPGDRDWWSCVPIHYIAKCGVCLGRNPKRLNAHSFGTHSRNLRLPQECKTLLLSGSSAKKRGNRGSR